MNVKSYLILAVAICAIHQISAFNFCNCREQGVDVCSCKKGITAPRPYPIQLPRLQRPLIRSICRETLPSQPKPFEPIDDDACHCGQQIVKPAPLPRVRSGCQQNRLPRLQFPRPSCSCNSCLGGDNEQKKASDCGQAVRAPEQYQNFNQDGATIYFESAKKKQATAPKPRVPADVVSIAIAKRLASSAKNGISERNLQYGSLKEPTYEQKTQKTQSNINEELFYESRGKALEIQPYIFKQEKHESTEEDSSEEKPKKPSFSAFNPGQLDFEQIGYKPYEAAKPRYVVVKNSDPVKHECNQQRQPRRHHHKKAQSCDCYKDLVVDQSGISEQSVSYESQHDNQFNPRFST